MKAPATTKVFVCLVAMLIVFSMAASVTAAAQQFTAPDHVNITLNGCRNDGSITLPISGNFVCPDADYTSGNLGKGWNELDLVPHRLITNRASQSNTPSYNVIVAADYSLSGNLGYDVIFSDVGASGPGINESHAGDASCSATWGPQQVGPGITGGADSTVYRVVTITQNANTTCYIDYYERLALGAAQYSGSSLQSYKFESGDFKTGKFTIPLPVNQIKPQSLSKTMDATQGSSNVWLVGKEVPASLAFANVCDPTLPLSKSVKITVSWTKTPTLNGIDITTTISATNPASRTITVAVSDTIYIGTDQSTALDTTTTPVGGVDVPANTTVTVLTHHTTDPNTGDSDFNDIATASYTDKITGVPVPGTATAKASATKTSLTGTNNSATISDQEDIGSNFEFSLDSFNGTGGYAGGSVTNPSGYTLGNFVSSLTWLSNAFTADGTATFNKTVEYTGTGPGSANLTDTATLTGSDGFTTDSGQQKVAIEADALVSLTIQKTITPFVAQTVTFHITNSQSVEVATPTVTFAAGDPSTKSTTVNNLQPDTYTVTETVPTGWSGSPASVPLTLDASSQNSCSGTASFTNTQQAKIIVKKVTKPSGSSQSFTFTPSYNGGQTFNLTDGQTNDSGLLAPGSGYSVAETAVSGWDLTSKTCDNGNDPGSITLAAGQTVTCTFTNTQEGTIIIKKLTSPSGASGSFTFTGTAAGSIGDGGTITVNHLTPGTYYSTESDPTPAFDLTSISCDDGSSANPSSGSVSTRKATFKLDAGETVTCTFTNTQRGKAKVVKTFNGGAIPAGTSFTFQLRSGASAAAAGTILETLTATSANSGVLNFTTNLVPESTYQLCEQMQPGWLTTLGPPAYSVYNPSGDNSVVCTDFTVTAGQTKTFNINNQPPPGGMGLTIGFWKNWSSCGKSNGGQKPVLDQTILKFPIASGQSTHGDFIGTLYVDTCQEAVSILSKQTLSGKQMSSDPGYNLAAQLLGADLNVAAGAGQSTCSMQNIASAHDLLSKVGFNGTSATKMTSAQAAKANALATQIDNYNNNRPVSCVPYP
jgi:hypothetical protein